MYDYPVLSDPDTDQLPQLDPLDWCQLPDVPTFPPPDQWPAPIKVY